jgi:uncharacterized membrane protein YfcA
LIFLQKQRWLDGGFYRNLLLICALILPTSLLGQLLKSLLSRIFGDFIACVSIGSLLLAFIFALYFAVLGKKKGRINEKNPQKKIKKGLFPVAPLTIVKK